jgi:hypothetical protein
MILSLYDITGIQSYIFGSNRLKEILGASLLVDRALTNDLDHAMAGVEGIKRCWSGGGNALVEAPEMSAARAVATSLSASLHGRAPGLGLSCHHEDWDGEPGTYGAAYQRAQQRLADRKAARWPEAHFDGAGVTALCAATGELATEWDEGRWVSPSTVAKLDAAEDANDRLRFYALPSGYAYTNETDKLGRTPSERSMVGVIHFDGNGMGKRFREAAERRDAQARLPDLSDAVEAAGKATLVESLAWVSSHLQALTCTSDGGFKLCEREDGVLFFPVRPIVFGGDDITLVCDARIALDVAAKLLEVWQLRSEEHLGETAHACAGVAIVKSHHPLHRAYQLAESLCRGAKKAVRDQDASALDFEVHTGGPVLSLEEARDRDRARVAHDGGHKQERAPFLHARPYFVGGSARRASQSWTWFRRDLLGVLQGDGWKEFHTQLRGLAPMLHDGREATRVHLQVGAPPTAWL